ncbi:hypothetical protein GCM10010207_42230 [Streptomyces atratus]|nr:hypothetical protein GCM10010207_42230 [Streptomyces atratus]
MVEYPPADEFLEAVPRLKADDMDGRVGPVAGRARIAQVVAALPPRLWVVDSTPKRPWQRKADVGFSPAPTCPVTDA